MYLFENHFKSLFAYTIVYMCVCDVVSKSFTCICVRTSCVLISSCVCVFSSLKKEVLPFELNEHNNRKTCSFTHCKSNKMLQKNSPTLTVILEINVYISSLYRELFWCHLLQLNTMIQQNISWTTTTSCTALTVDVLVLFNVYDNTFT